MLRVGIRGRCFFVVEESGAFARICSTEFPWGVGTPSHEATAEESLEVDDEVELHFGKRFDHGEQPAKPLFSLKHQGLVDGFAGMDQRGEDFANNPRDMPVWVCTFEAFDGLKAVDDVPERGGFDDENSGHGALYWGGRKVLLAQFGFEMSSVGG